MLLFLTLSPKLGSAELGSHEFKKKINTVKKSKKNDIFIVDKNWRQFQVEPLPDRVSPLPLPYSLPSSKFEFEFELSAVADVIHEYGDGNDIWLNPMKLYHMSNFLCSYVKYITNLDP